MGSIKKIEDKLNLLKLKEGLLRSQLKKDRSSLRKEERYNLKLIKARAFLSDFSKNKQRKFKKRIEIPITMVLRIVFPERNFDFKVLFNTDRKDGRIENRLVIMEDGEEYIPKDDLGGSAVDLVSIIFRVVLISLECPKSRPTLLLDEPLKRMGRGEYLQRSLRVFSLITENFDIQLIILTHIEEFLDIADNVYQVVRRGVKAVVEKIEIK